MGSLGTGEIVVIVLVALIIFGPHRIPEISRKAGEFLAKAREMSRSVTDSFGDELSGITDPIKDLKSEYDSTMGEMKSAASSVTGMSLDIPEVSLNPKDILKSKPEEAVAAEAGDEPSDSGAVAEAVDDEPSGGAKAVEAQTAGDEPSDASPDEEAS